MILPLFGGIFLDTIGMKWGILLFSSLLVVGQLVFMLGGFLENFWVMIAGRVIFGLGGENLSVSQSAIVSKWFKGKELAFSLAVNISVSSLGSVINGWVVPPIYTSSGLGYALLVGVFVTIFSMICAVALVILDEKADKVDGATIMITDEDKFKCSDLKKFTLPFWLICGSCVLSYMSIFPFMQVVTDMLQTRFCISEQQAPKIYGIPYIISACSSPFLGILIDKIGKRVIFIFFSSSFILAGHLLTMFIPDSCPETSY